MFFIQNEHRQRFAKAVADSKKFHPATGVINREYGTAFYLLTSMPDIWRRCEKYTKDGIDFPEILENVVLSTGERVIVQLAWALFSAWGDNGFSISDMINHLDMELYQLSIEAISMRRFGDLQMQLVGSEV